MSNCCTTTILWCLLKYSDDLSTQFWTEFALYGVFVESLQESPGHWFEERLDLIHYSARRKFTHLLQDIEAKAPLMVKFNKRRAGQYDLTVGEYARRVAEIRGISTGLGSAKRVEQSAGFHSCLPSALSSGEKTKCSKPYPVAAPPGRLEVCLRPYCRTSALRGWGALYRLRRRRGSQAAGRCRAMGGLHPPGAET